MQHLRIPDKLNGVITDTPLPDNLILSVSSDENRDHALIQLLEHRTFKDLQSIIIYCSRRKECDRVAKFLRTHFQVNYKHFNDLKLNIILHIILNKSFLERHC